MSLLTRCPACTTLYRVVPDQLRISEGWVKCGQCSEIFDASQHLIEAACDPEPQIDTTVETVTMVDSPVPQDFEEAPLVTASQDNPEPDAITQDLTAHPTDFTHDLESEATTEVAIEVDQPTEVIAATGIEDETLSDDQVVLTDGNPVSEISLQPDQIHVRWDDDPAARSATPSPADETPEGDAPVTFLQDSQRQSPWRKPLVRGILVFVSLALGLALMGQWVRVERDQLAAQQPELKPMLQAFCNFTNCQIQPLKRIESLSVDSVGFHQLGKDTYRLGFVVKNFSVLPLAFPNVELALTDTLDQAVFRRVFSAMELGVADAVIAAGAERPVAVVLRVNSEATSQRVLGYRLLIFYP